MRTPNGHWLTVLGHPAGDALTEAQRQVVDGVGVTDDAGHDPPAFGKTLRHDLKHRPVPHASIPIPMKSSTRAVVADVAVVTLAKQTSVLR